MIAGHAALLARKSGRPVKMVYDRHEDMAATTKRHPARVRHRTGVTRDGTMVAQDIDIVMDGGAYVTLSPVVLSRGALHATGPYACPNVRIRARARRDEHAAERRVPRLRRAADAVRRGAAHREDRRRAGPRFARRAPPQHGREAATMLATGQTLRESVGAPRSARHRASSARGYRASCSASTRAGIATRRSPTWRGVGLALVLPRRRLHRPRRGDAASRAAVLLTRDGRFKALAASTEIGQGPTTTFAQITADALGVAGRVAWRSRTPDTWKVPNSGPTVASRTVMIVGGLMQQRRRRELRRRRRRRRAARWPCDARGNSPTLAARACGDEPFVRFEADVSASRPRSSGTKRPIEATPTASSATPPRPSISRWTGRTFEVTRAEA